LAHPQAIEFSLAMPTMRPFLHSSSLAFTAGISDQRRGETNLRPYRAASATAPDRGRPVPKMAREALTNSSARQYSYADEIGTADLSQIKTHQFRDKN
jgi:hypothetical protein